MIIFIFAIYDLKLKLIINNDKTVIMNDMEMELHLKNLLFSGISCWEQQRYLLDE